jgi:hypothetical protein
MTMTAKIRGYRGVERADIDIGPVALVGGLNGAGKTSIAEAIAAAVCGTPIPFFKASKPDKALLTKADAKDLLRGGMDLGLTEVSLDGKVSCSTVWPKLVWEGDGRISCSKYAAGLLSVMDLEDVDRQKFFAELLGAKPTTEDLRIELMEKVPSLGDDKGGENLKKLLDMVNVSGFDPVHASTKETGSRLKGQWEAATADNFGSKKATDWKPATWRVELANKSLEEIGTECTEAEAKWQKAAAALALGDEAIAELQEKAKVEESALKLMNDKAASVDVALRFLNDQRKAVEDIEVPTSLACAHCGGMLNAKMKDGVVIALEDSDISANEIAELADAKAAAQKKLDSLNADYLAAQKSLTEAKEAYAAVKGAAAQLEAAHARKGSQESVDQALDYLNAVKRDKVMVESVAQAARISRLIADNQKIVDILAPEGLRRQKLVKALARFNQQFLAVLCANAEYPAVTLDNDLEVLYGGRRHFLLSKSEQYRVKAVLQLAIAMYDKSPLVIYDGADILDAPGRNGLFAMIAAAEGINFLVCMTVASKEKLPDLAEAGMGESFWMESGIASPLVERSEDAG